MTIGPGAKESYAGVFIENILYGNSPFPLRLWDDADIILRFLPVGVHRMLRPLVEETNARLEADLRASDHHCYVHPHHHEPDGLHFGVPNSPMGITTNACWFFVTAVADAFIIFRTFIVWKKNWYVIILPSLLFLANFGCAIWGLYSLVSFNPTRSVFTIVVPVNNFIYFTLSTNVLCTSPALISYRIFTIRRKVAGVVSNGGVRSDGATSKILSILVESAAAYTLLLIAQLITNTLHSYVTYILIDCTPATIGLVFSYIIIRVSRGSSYGDTTGRVDTSLSRDRNNFELSQTRNGRSGTRSEVQVKLERVVVQHSDVDTGSRDDESHSKKYPDASMV
ncbi:hypothetical protein C8R44DRAFT_745525 [Mycena epipterygia]|nr:hypothetical protein C8R44DRAFT_745525 [Mycena epipterygia]